MQIRWSSKYIFISVAMDPLSNKEQSTNTDNANSQIKSSAESSHKGSQSSFKGVDIEQLIEDGGCGVAYYALEECLSENDRKWAKCQNEVKALQLCKKENEKKR